MASLALTLIVTGFVLTVTFGPSLICLRRPHKWGPWQLVSIKYEQRTCRRCLRGETRKDAWWAAVTAPAKPNTPPTAPTVEAPLVSSRTGTTEIPRLPNGALSCTPTPPRVAGDRHVVLDHE